MKAETRHNIAFILTWVFLYFRVPFLGWCLKGNKKETANWRGPDSYRIWGFELRLGPPAGRSVAPQGRARLQACHDELQPLGELGGGWAA